MNMNARCVMPLVGRGRELCSEPATTEREAEGLMCPLCSTHAEQLDREADEARTGRSSAGEMLQ